MFLIKNTYNCLLQCFIFLNVSFIPILCNKDQPFSGCCFIFHYKRDRFRVIPCLPDTIGSKCDQLEGVKSDVNAVRTADWSTRFATCATTDIHITNTYY